MEVIYQQFTTRCFGQKYFHINSPREKQTNRIQAPSFGDSCREDDGENAQMTTDTVTQIGPGVAESLFGGASDKCIHHNDNDEH